LGSQILQMEHGSRRKSLYHFEWLNHWPDLNIVWLSKNGMWTRRLGHDPTLFEPIARNGVRRTSSGMQSQRQWNSLMVGEGILKAYLHSPHFLLDCGIIDRKLVVQFVQTIHNAPKLYQHKFSDFVILEYEVGHTTLSQVLTLSSADSFVQRMMERPWGSPGFGAHIRFISLSTRMYPSSFNAPDSMPVCTCRSLSTMLLPSHSLTCPSLSL
jgi:hypothetical protein